MTTHSKLLLTALGLSLSAVAYADGFDDTQPASAFYINGVLTDPLDALTSSIELSLAWSQMSQKVPGIRFGLAYNPTDPKGYGDLIEAIRQVGSDSKGAVRGILGVGPLSARALDILRDAFVNSMSLSAETQGVIANHLSLYRDRFAQKHKVILVAHSQGNLFALEEYKRLDPLEQACTYTVAVATPSNEVPAKGDYVTLKSDEIILAASALRVSAGLPPAKPGNVDPDLLNEAATDNSRGHAFVKAYMVAGAKSRQAILEKFEQMRELSRTEGTPCNPVEKASTLTIYRTFGGPITPIPIGYSTTTTNVNDGVSTTTDFSDPTFQGLANYIGEDRRSDTFQACKIDDRWIPKHSVRVGELKPDPLRTQCSGQGYDEVDTSDFSVEGGTLTANFTVDGKSSTSCDDTVGLVVNKTVASMTNYSLSTMVINLETGTGSYSRTLGQTSNYTHTYTGSDGLKTSVSNSTTTGGANGSWSAARPEDPLANTRIEKYTQPLAPGAEIPAQCQ